MINLKEKLDVFYYNGSFTDYTNDAVNYLADNFTITHAASDYLYIGLEKPFNAVFIEMKIANVNNSNMIVEQYNGTSWVSVEHTDETRGLKRSAFLRWEKADMEPATINSKEAYYIRISFSADTSAIEYKGINIIFSDDAQLKQEFFEIDQLRPSGENSFISKHVSAKNEILDRLKQRGTVKTVNSKEDDVNAFDLHDIHEIRQAATYMALAKIFFNLSDNIQDHWWAKYLTFQQKAESALQLFQIEIDSNNDGLNNESDGDKRAKQIRFSR